MTKVIGSGQVRKDKVPIIVFVLSIIFVICNSAESIYFFERYLQASLNCHNFTFLSITFNASVNAFVYGVFNKKYRIMFSQLICHQWKKENISTEWYALEMPTRMKVIETT